MERDLKKASLFDYALMYLLAAIAGGGAGGLIGFQAMTRGYSKHIKESMSRADQWAQSTLHSWIAGGVFVACIALTIGLNRDKRQKEEDLRGRADRDARRQQSQQSWERSFGPKE